ncbi:MAG TPA: hypothetical protein VKS21_13055, partial [Spirochaetota bacterium]|nr:hypothetical protein [Spirochaetota bacterium]
MNEVKKQIYKVLFFLTMFLSILVSSCAQMEKKPHVNPYDPQTPNIRPAKSDTGRLALIKSDG